MKKLFYSKRTAPIVALLLAVCVLGSIASAMKHVPSAMKHVPSAMRHVPDAELMEIRGMTPCNCCIDLGACYQYSVNTGGSAPGSPHDNCLEWSNGSCMQPDEDCNALVTWMKDLECMIAEASEKCEQTSLNYCKAYRTGTCEGGSDWCDCGDLSTEVYYDGVASRCEFPYSDWCSG